MARKKEKQKKGNWGERGMLPFLLPMIFIAITIVILLILIKNPEICLFGKSSCFRLVPLAISKGFSFYLTLLGFFLVQIVIVWFYWTVGTKVYSFGRRAVFLIRTWTTNIKRYIILHH
jgi:hypothetical protein